MFSYQIPFDFLDMIDKGEKYDLVETKRGGRHRGWVVVNHATREPVSPVFGSKLLADDVRRRLVNE